MLAALSRLSLPLLAALASTARCDPPATAEAVHADTAIILDGRGDESFWSHAPAASLARLGQTPPRQAGNVRFAWNERHLYLFADFIDDDAVATGRSGRVSHQTEGDVLELFIGPVGRSWYWEIHYTPAGLRSAFFFPSAGRRFGSNITESPRLRHRHSVVIEGTLNEWRDRDTGWSAEISIPWADLAVDDDEPPPAPGDWRVLVGRYDYSRWQDEVEISFWPPLSALRFHRPDFFAPLLLRAPETGSAPPPASEPKSSKRSKRNARG